HPPIYSTRELAKLLAEHDQGHPDHGNDCTCHHGLFKAARTLFASTARPVSVAANEPRPYVSPDVLRGTTRG
ncbi:MAG: hypothetical protein ACREBC_32645, partial [Pyrinomonadaceae bacterium]